MRPDLRPRRSVQLMPTGDLLDEIYEGLATAEDRVLQGGPYGDDVRPLAQAIRHLNIAVQLLADLVDREQKTRTEEEI